TWNRKPHRTHFDADRLPRISTARHVPHIGGHYASRANYPHHLSHPFDRIGNERNHQRHRSCIERVRRKREGHGVPTAEFGDTRCGSFVREGQLTLGWINSLDLDWRISLDNQLSESAVSAANIYPLQARSNRKPFKKDLSRTSAPISRFPL